MDVPYVIILAAVAAAASTGATLAALTFTAILKSNLLGKCPSKTSVSSLCVADFFLGVASIFIVADEYIKLEGVDVVTGRRLACASAVLKCVWDSVVKANILSRLIMTVELFVCVHWPLQSFAALTTRRVLSSVVAAWLLSFALGLAPLAVMAYETTESTAGVWMGKGTTRLCYQIVLYEAFDGEEYLFQFNQRNDYRLLVIPTAALLAFAFCAMVATYGYVCRIVLKTGSRKSRPREPWEGSRRIVHTIFIITTTFLLCYLPMFVYHVARTFGSYPEASDVEFGSLLLTVVTTTVSDPLIYSLRTSDVKASFRRLFCPRHTPAVSRGVRISVWSQTAQTVFA